MAWSSPITLSVLRFLEVEPSRAHTVLLDRRHETCHASRGKTAGGMVAKPTCTEVMDPLWVVVMRSCRPPRSVASVGWYPTAEGMRPSRADTSELACTGRRPSFSAQQADRWFLTCLASSLYAAQHIQHRRAHASASLWITCPEQLEVHKEPAVQRITSADMLSSSQQAPFQLDQVCWTCPTPVISHAVPKAVLPLVAIYRHLWIVRLSLGPDCGTVDIMWQSQIATMWHQVKIYPRTCSHSVAIGKNDLPP